MDAEDLKNAAWYSYLLDSWYNPSGLRNVFRFAYRRNKDFFLEFSAFVEPYCEVNSGKLPLEKRFELLENFFAEHDEKALELCRFAKIANGFRCKGIEMKKYTGTDAGFPIWNRPGLENPEIKRCIIFESSFNAADFWLEPQSRLIDRPEKYIFKLHYGRNPAAIASLTETPDSKNFCSGFIQANCLNKTGTRT